MALINCKECGTEISNKATSCPSCGAPGKKKSMGCGTVIVLVGGILYITYSLRDLQPENQKTPVTSKQSEIKQPAPKTAKATKELQDQRKQLIEKMIAEGILTEIKMPGTIPKVYCTEKWRLAKIGDKEKLASTILFWSYNLPNGTPLGYEHIINFYDASTGKKFADMDKFGYNEF